MSTINSLLMIFFIVAGVESTNAALVKVVVDHKRMVDSAAHRVVCLTVTLHGRFAQADVLAFGIDSPTEIDRSDSAQAEGRDTQNDAADNSIREKRKRMGTVGVILLSLVAILGVFAVTFSVLWAGRLRRIVRQDRAGTTEYDPFWYLKGTSKSSNKDDPTSDAAETHDDEDGEQT